MKIVPVLFLSLSVVFAISSCKSDKNNSCVAGTGGNVTVIAKPQHHGAPILNHDTYPDSAFVKFNAKEYPGSDPSLYDLVLGGDAPEDHVHIEGLKCGDYFIYMSGFDTTIQQRVTGGIAVNIIQTSGEKIVNVPVTE